MDIAWLLLLTPLVATIAILLHLHRKPDMAIFASVGSASLCFLIALGVAFGGIQPPTPYEWISLPGWNVDIGMIFDPLSKGMLLVITGVGLLIHIYSIGYMAHDKSKGRFFGGLSIFMFSMTGIALADNLIMMFLFWEGVGLSSYLLIGFWYEKESAAQAANKAFVCNRLADFGFMIGILTFWLLMHTVSVRPEILGPIFQNNQMPRYGSILNPGSNGGSAGNTYLLFIMVFGLFCGCVGKSAMFPLHVWLPDAMEGPTPVSALIHAATMVAAGVYMLCRVYPLLLLSGAGMNIIAIIGCFTSIFAALIAVQQNDIKRILAYSTLSQLGYMVMAVGCEGPDAAMFHLTTHAFFKALLFLAAGSVIHALHDEQDIWKMGGLYNKIPLTFGTFAIGMLALSGVPPFAGFWSKDYLLSIAYARSPLFYWVGVLTAFLTAFYMTRLVVVAFFGPARTPAAEHPHESPKVMTIPLILLAILSFFGGFIGIKDFYHGWFVDVIHTMVPLGVVSPVESTNTFIELVLPGSVVAIGIVSACYLYWDCKTDPLDIKMLANKFYFDEFYDRSIVGGQQMAARFLNWIDAWILDGLIIRGSAYVTFGVGEIFRLFQTGSLQGYAFLFSLGGLILIYFMLFTHQPPVMNLSPLLGLLLAPLIAMAFIIILRAPPQRTALIATAFNLVLSIGLLWNYHAAQGGYAYVMDYPWMTIPGLPTIRFHLAADGISLPLIFLTGIVSLAAIAISPANIRRASEYYCYLLFMSLGAMGAFTSLDLFFFFIFHDFALIATFLLIGIWGSQNRQYASFQVTIYLMTGSLVLLTGFVAIVMALPPEARTFDIVALQNYIVGIPGDPAHPAHLLASTTQDIIFLLLLVGFGILVGLFPFHSWAPPGYASAPPAAAMLHAGILKKFAIYGMIRIAIPLVHDGFTTCLPIILTLLAGNFLYAGFVTLAQKELPLMIGFSSIMHMGYLFLGVACWNEIGVTGAVVLMVGHGLSAALLFGLTGEITHRSGENRFAELGGLAKRAPVLAVLFSFASMATMGVPGLANFAGEIMVFFGSFSAVQPVAFFFIPGLIFFGVIAIYGTVLTAIFQLRALKSVFYGPMPARYLPQTAVAQTAPAVVSGGEAAFPFPGMTDTSALVEHGPYVLLLLASLVIGFMPFLMIHLIEPSVSLLPYIAR